MLFFHLLWTFLIVLIDIGKDTDAYMNRNIGLGNNKYTFFSAESPATFTTKTQSIAPDMSSLPPEAFDATGKVKAEFYETVVRRAYPEKHSVWDKLSVSGDLTIAAFSAWLLQEHQLVLDSWNFIYGYRSVADADSGAKETVGVTTKVSNHLTSESESSTRYLYLLPRLCCCPPPLCSLYCWLSVHMVVMCISMMLSGCSWRDWCLLDICVFSPGVSSGSCA